MVFMFPIYVGESRGKRSLMFFNIINLPETRLLFDRHIKVFESLKKLSNEEALKITQISIGSNWNHKPLKKVQAMETISGNL